MIVFYHNDHDGECSGFWVMTNAEHFKKHGHPKYQNNRCQSINYNMPFPFEMVEKDERVYIVDFSIEPSDMDKLLEITKDVIWIDHHKTAIEKYEDYSHELAGTRQDGTAGCELTYAFFEADDEPPMFTKYIGDRDVWKHALGDNTNYFCLGLLSYDTHPQASIWQELCTDEEKTEEIIEQGRAIKQYRDSWAKSYRNKFGGDCVFEGYYCKIMNLAQCGSEYFGEDIETYDIVIPFAYDCENNNWVVSLYSTKEDIDVSEIAKKHGGGGHKGASGFTVEGDVLELFKDKNVSRFKNKTTTSGKPSKLSTKCPAPEEINESSGQHGAYWVLSEEERAKGFVNPVKESYVHVGIRPKYPLCDLDERQKELYGDTDWVKYEEYPEDSGENGQGRFWTQAELDSGCGTVTTMGLALAETYAREPRYYGSTFCCNCNDHIGVKEFVWEGTEIRLGEMFPKE